MRILLLLVLALGPAAAQIPVNCGDFLNIPGGNYILTGNLSCSISIFITADNVTFDLQGFTLTNGSSGPIAAIITSNPTICVATRGIQIRNGTISGFGTGISLCTAISPGGPRTTGARVQNMSLTGNGRGIFVNYASDVQIHKNEILNSHYVWGSTPLPVNKGIFLSNVIDSQVKHNVINGSTEEGIVFADNSDDNTVMQNSLTGNLTGGIKVKGGSGDNVIKHNKAVTNGVFDLIDENSGCLTNTWKNNTFGTRNQACIQ